MNSPVCRAETMIVRFIGLLVKTQTRVHCFDILAQMFRYRDTQWMSVVGTYTGRLWEAQICALAIRYKYELFSILLNLFFVDLIYADYKHSLNKGSRENGRPQSSKKGESSE